MEKEVERRKESELRKISPIITLLWSHVFSSVSRALTACGHSALELLPGCWNQCSSHPVACQLPFHCSCRL